MIKIDNKRYHLDEIKVYYPIEVPSGAPAIVFQWRNKQPDTIVEFPTKEIRNMNLNAMDDLLVVIKDGTIIERSMNFSPLLYSNEDDGGSFIQ